MKIKFIKFFALLLSYIINRKLILAYQYFINFSISYSQKRNLKKCGHNFLIEYPIVSHGLKYISIGDNFNSFARLRLEAFDKHLDNTYTPEIIIGDNVSLNYDVHIGCVNKIVIGNNVLIASKVFITDHYHGNIGYEDLKTPPSLRKVISKGPVIIENNVWIGEGVAIMPNIRIGKNAIIGANAVVTKDIPENAVVGGIPAKIIKILGE